MFSSRSLRRSMPTLAEMRNTHPDDADALGDWTASKDSKMRIRYADSRDERAALVKASHLMKVLFAARLCRPDLLVAITRLASKVSCWQACHDRALRRLFSYILHHADMELFGTIKTSDLETCEIWMSPDADLNGDMETSKSTSGLWVELASADGLRTWPLAWRSKRQGSTASSTPEAETISMATGLKSEGLPMQDLFSAALGRTVHLRCLEDNTTAITAARAGYSPALRHLPRTERISVGVLYEVLVESGDCTLQYQASAEHKGDMFTKRLDPATFEAAIARANLRRMTQLAAWPPSSRLRSLPQGGCVVAAHERRHLTQWAARDHHLLLNSVSP